MITDILFGAATGFRRKVISLKNLSLCILLFTMFK